MKGQSLRLLLVGLVLSLIPWSMSCKTVHGNKTKAAQEIVRKAGVTDYANEGKLWFVGVSVRAARLNGPGEMLPLNLTVVNKTAPFSSITREGFILQAPDGTMLPVASYGEFDATYGRDRQDLRAGQEFTQRFTGRFPAPPFMWHDLEFFPPRNSATVPRDRFDVRQGDLVFGYIYFGKPSSNYEFPEGKYKLLFKPTPGDETYVVEMFPF